MKRPLFPDTPLYTAIKKDSDHDYLDGGRYRYIFTLDKDRLPASAFWSLTVYRLAGHSHKEDPIRRYLIQSPLFSRLAKDDEGSYSIYLQRDSPGRDKESNWLPPPKDLFFLVIRVYLPIKEASMVNFNGTFVKKQASNLYVVNRNDMVPDFTPRYSNVRGSKLG